jgi:hypothetical protein
VVSLTSFRPYDPTPRIEHRSYRSDLSSSPKRRGGHMAQRCISVRIILYHQTYQRYKHKNRFHCVHNHRVRRLGSRNRHRAFYFRFLGLIRGWRYDGSFCRYVLRIMVPLVIFSVPQSYPMPSLRNITVSHTIKGLIVPSIDIARARINL